jgi:phosphate transport system substrate-binding protein
MTTFYRRGLILFFFGNFILALFSGCGSVPENENQDDANELKGTISISGAFALYPLTIKWAEEFQKLHPGVRIDISAGGAGKGMTDALSGMVDLAMFSRGILQSEIDQGCWWVAVTKDAVLPTVNDKNPWLNEVLERGITRSTFQKIYLEQDQSGWSDIIGKPGLHRLNVYTRSDACGAAQMWGEYLGKDQESLKGIGVFGDPGMADAVKKDIYGLGYNNVIYVYDLKTRISYPGLRVIPIDLNGNGVIDKEENFYSTLDEVMEAIRTALYPAPPARELYFVSKGKPQKRATLEFLKWILSEGQNYVHEAGYVNLPKATIKNELVKINQ